MKTRVFGIVLLLVCLTGAVTCKADGGSQRTLREWTDFFLNDAKLSSLVALRGQPTTIRGNIYIFAGALANGSNEGGNLVVSVAQAAGTNIVVGMGADENSIQMFPWLAKVREANNPPSRRLQPKLQDIDSQIELLDAQIEARREEWAKKIAKQKQEERNGAMHAYMGKDTVMEALKARRDLLTQQRAALSPSQ